MRAPFYFHPRMLEYDFGDRHPLKPVRLQRTIELLQRLGIEPLDPGVANRRDALRVHSTQYVDAVEMIDSGLFTPNGFQKQAGFGTVDTPSFPGMYDASMAYLGGSIRAAEAVRDGADLAISLSGGLHHAHRDHASGFCIFNDCAAAIDVLLERFSRVAYVDIDVHHGDGVQHIWANDSRVLTYSIHEDPATLFPGTGRRDEHGPDFTTVNVPIVAKSTGDVWSWAFGQTCLPTLAAFRPEAIVLQMGTDIHYLDPLGHIRGTAQDWLSAVSAIRDLGVPIVALGGGGYNLQTVPRMWAAATLTLLEQDVPHELPPDLAEAWGVRSVFDEPVPEPRNVGMKDAEGVAAYVQATVIPRLADLTKV